MGFFSSFTNMSDLTMKLSSSIFSSGFNFICGKSGFNSFIDVVVTFLCKIFYFASKWMLFILDLLFSFIKQLCGLEMSYESLEKMVSKESDFVFNLLISSTETITPIIKSLIGIAIALIIFFAILAVIKTSFDSLKTKSPADIRGVVTKTLRAFVLLIITPMLAIVGIIASNTILKSLYNATNVSNSNGISSQLFYASASSANAYRVYAQTGVKIPMTFDFTQEKEILEYYKDKELTPEFKEYLTSTKNLIFTNYQEFQNDEFTEFSRLNDTFSATGSAAKRAEEYYMYYDRGSSYVNGTGANIYKKILAYKPEYYVMADVIEFCINTGTKAYFKTIEEMLDSIVELDDDNLFNSVISMYDIEFLNSDLKKIMLGHITNTNTEASPEDSSNNTYKKIYKKENWRVIRFTSTYYDADNSSTPTRKMDIQYNHVRGETDELEGAKYVMCISKNVNIDSVRYSYFYPLTIGYTSGADTGSFDSDYVQMNQIISAKGIFSDGKYPTAIRQTADGAEVQFYRHELTTVTIGDSSQVATGDMKAEEQSGIKKFFQKLQSLLSPKINANIDTDQVAVAYTYEEIIVNNLASGTLSISYMFEDSFSNLLGGIITGASNIVRSASGAEGTEQIGLFGLKLENVYIPRKINMVVLVLGSLMLLKIVFTNIFVLINRGYELFLTIMIYPAACATIPIDESGYQQWTRTYVGRLFSTYGLVLGLNFVLMLFPVISELEIFTAGDIALSKSLMRFRNLFSIGGLIPISLEFLAKFLNLICIILFELVAFTLLETLPETISGIVGASNVKGINPLETFAKASKVIISAVSTIASAGGGIAGFLKDTFLVLSPNKKTREKAREKIKQKTKDKLDKVKKQALRVVPGSEIIGAARDKANLNEKKKAQKEAEANLKEAMQGGKKVKDENGKEREMTSEERAKDVENAYKQMLDAQSAYSNALKDPRGNREAEDEKKKEAEELGTDESSRNNDEDVDIDEEGNIDAKDVSYKSEKELKKSKGKQENAIKKLENKVASGEKLTEQEQIALKYQKAKLAKTDEALEIKNQYKEAVKQVEALEKKNATGAFSADDQSELERNRKIVEAYETARNSDSETKKERKAENKAHQKERKASEKASQESAKIKQKFTTGSKFSQMRYMKKNTRQQEKAAKKLAKVGIAKNDIMTYSGDMLDGLNKKQRKQVLKYQNSFNNIDDAQKVLQNETVSKANYDAQRKAQYQMYKNRNKAGTRRGEKVLNKNRLNEQDRQQQLQLIDNQLANMGTIDAQNIKKYQELQSRKAKLVAEQKFQERWETQTHKSKDQLKAEAKNYRYQEKVNAYKYDMGTYKNSEEELEKQVREEFKKKGKYNPSDSDVQKRMKEIKEQRKNNNGNK